MGEAVYLLLVCVAAACVSLGSALWAAAQVRAGWPKLLKALVEDLAARVTSAEATVERVQGQYLAKIAEMEAVAEEIEGLLESVERKRKRAAGAKGGASTKPAEPADRHGELLRLARSQGHPV